jgi:hypothetical protein
MTSAPQNSEWLTVRQVAQMLQAPAFWVYGRIRKCCLTAFRLFSPTSTLAGVVVNSVRMPARELNQIIGTALAKRQFLRLPRRCSVARIEARLEMLGQNALRADSYRRVWVSRTSRPGEDSASGLSRRT